MDHLTPFFAHFARVAPLLILLTGDFNIGLLKINERSDFYYCLLTRLSHGLLHVIIFLTRLAQNSASLIDNIFSNLSTVRYHSSGILLSDISDHLPYYFSINCVK